MQFLPKQLIGAFVTTCIISSVLGIPILEAENQVLETRQGDPKGVPYVMWWATPDFTPANEFLALNEPQDRRGKGDCQNLGAAADNLIKSAKAPIGWKCTLYQFAGCHGMHTREFNSDGIPSMPNPRLIPSAWRCCKIGETNYWGYCDAKLNGASL